VKVVILGAAGHASDTLELVRRSRPDWEIAGLLVDWAPDKWRFEGRAEIVGKIDPADLNGAAYIVGVGYPATRRSLAERMGAASVAPGLVDPSAVVSSSADVGEGAAVFWGASVSPLARIGPHALVSYGATVGHDSSLGAYVSVMPGAHIGGDVTIGDGVLVGAGAVVLEKLTIGEGATIAAGAVVVRDVAPQTMVRGVPAQ
jgi:sugar O-acyltransferase (sialic acid O-acetyltransferase NeuD family)